MKIRMMAVAALALSAACGGTTPPENGPAPRNADEDGPVTVAGPGVGGSGPNVFALIGQRERLALTGPQVVELDSIGRAWSLVNDSVQRELHGRGGDRTTTMEAVRPLLLRMAENNESANRAVEALLNDEQRRIACTLQPPQAQGEVRRPAQGTRPGARPGGRMGGRPGARPDAEAVTPVRRGWPWCGPAAPADSAR